MGCISTYESTRRKSAAFPDFLLIFDYFCYHRVKEFHQVRLSQLSMHPPRHPADDMIVFENQADAGWDQNKPFVHSLFDRNRFSAVSPFDPKGFRGVKHQINRPGIVQIRVFLFLIKEKNQKY